MKTDRFKLINRIDPSSRQDQALKNYYYEWKINNKNKGFTMIHDNFKSSEILSKIDGGALKLYIFLSLASKNNTGESWYGVKHISKYFDVQTRTVDKWFNNLIELDLIRRHRHKKQTNTTYLLPYEDTTINHRSINANDNSLDEIVPNAKKILAEFEDIYGEISDYFHLFQWRNIKTTKEQENKTVPMNLLLIITKRKNGTKVGHIHILKKDMENKGIGEMDIANFHRFESPLSVEDENKSIKGLALPNFPKVIINTNKQTLIDLLAQLDDITDNEFFDLEEVIYGEIEEFDFEEEEEEEEEEKKEEKE